MTKELTHWESAKETAKNYFPVCSIAYASDHLEALLETRLMVKPDNFNKSDWESYKATTDKITQAIESIKAISIQHYGATNPIN